MTIEWPECCCTGTTQHESPSNASQKVLKEERRLDDCDSKPFKGPRPHGAKISMKNSIENGSSLKVYQIHTNYSKTRNLRYHNKHARHGEPQTQWRQTKAMRGTTDYADSFWRTSRKERAWLASDNSSWKAICHVHIHSHPTAIHLACPDLDISKKKTAKLSDKAWPNVIWPQKYHPNIAPTQIQICHLSWSKFWF